LEHETEIAWELICDICYYGHPATPENEWPPEPDLGAPDFDW
jgi:hypothetical protein